MNPESYQGPAVLRAGGEELAVEVRLSARFEPVEGRFRWAGRTTGAPGLRAGRREVLLTIPGQAPRPARVGDTDPWGGVRLSGTGTPPWWSP